MVFPGGSKDFVINLQMSVSCRNGQQPEYSWIIEDKKVWSLRAEQYSYRSLSGLQKFMELQLFVYPGMGAARNYLANRYEIPIQPIS